MGRKKKHVQSDVSATQDPTPLLMPVQAVPLSIRVGALMMVRNEERRILVSLKSVTGVVTDLILFDTGSTDSTVSVVREFCNTNLITLTLKQGAFIDFSTSRNELLDLADTVDVDWLVLLDCNDELRGGEGLCKFLQTPALGKCSTVMTSQVWKAGGVESEHFNLRIIRNRIGWRYKGVVHEYLDAPTPPDAFGNSQAKAPSSICIYQDRDQDDDKTSKRWHRDVVLLEEEFKRHPEDRRTVFYLAQTYECLGDLPNALRCYELRAEMSGGFLEEQSVAAMRCGDVIGKLARTLDRPDRWHERLVWYIKSYELCPDRVDAIVKIALHYTERRAWKLAYTFSTLACNSDYPRNVDLFIDKNAYDYTRWHVMGRCAYYVGEFKVGKAAVLKAIEARHLPIDQHNLEFYNQLKSAR